MENYFIVLLSGCLKIGVGDNLFVSMSRNDKESVQVLTNIAYSLGVNDLNIVYYEDNNNYKLWERYLVEGYKFLFMVGNNWNNTVSNRVADGLRNENIGIDFTIVPSPDVLFKYNDKFSLLSFKEMMIEFSKENSSYNRQINKIRNYKFNTIKLKSLSDLDLRIEFENDFKYHHSDVINMYPFYGIEMLAKKNTATGYVDATRETMIGNERVDDLRLCFKNGYLIDFDCSTNSLLTKKVFKDKYTFESITLVDSDTPMYNFLDSHGNYVLDTNSHSYITICSSDNDKIYVPIESKSLSVTGYGNVHKAVKIYEKQKITII